MTDFSAVERRALEIWQERERGMPARVRRMHPDRWDHCSGAWQRVLDQARVEVEAKASLTHEIGAVAPSYGARSLHSPPSPTRQTRGA